MADTQFSIKNHCLGPGYHYVDLCEWGTGKIAISHQASDVSHQLTAESWRLMTED